jgi:hydroxymethylbilane synthase
MVVAEIKMKQGHSVTFEIVPIKTQGDKVTYCSLAEIGGKALFSKEIHKALLSKKIDCAVHSLKDLETHKIPGIELVGVLERESPLDVLITKNKTHCDLFSLPRDSRIGTCAPRRRAQIKYHIPSCQPTLMRGNINTRLEKFVASSEEAIILAKAGLERLGLLGEDNQLLNYGLYYFDLPIDVMVPAAGQGVIAMECRSEDEELKNILGAISHRQTFEEVTIERKIVDSLGADCHTPVGVYCQKVSDGFWVRTFTQDEELRGVYKSYGVKN